MFASLPSVLLLPRRAPGAGLFVRRVHASPENVATDVTRPEKNGNDVIFYIFKRGSPSLYPPHESKKIFSRLEQRRKEIYLVLEQIDSPTYYFVFPNQ